MQSPSPSWHSKPSRHPKTDPRSYGELLGSSLPTLTIRNLTSSSTELKTIERLSHPTATTNNYHWTRIFGGNSATDQCYPEDFIAQDVNLQVAPFQVRASEIQPSANETLRLTFETQGQLYQLRIPCESEQSTVLTPLSSDPKHEYTAIYLPKTSYLAIYSSAKLNSWMSNLKDATPISCLSIPGTHNSPTCHSALPTVRCQGVSVREQLDNGIRFLDIRVSPASPHDASREELHLVHAVFPIALTGYKYLRHLINEVTAFLDETPSETVIISLKREGLSKATDQHVSKILHKHYAHDPAHWFTAPRIPALGEVRKKIVLVRRFHIDDSIRGEYGGAGWGIDGSDWPDNCEDGMCGSGDMRIQDYYDVNQTTHIDRKIAFSEAHLARAAACVATLPEDANRAPQEAAKHPIFINFLTGANFFKTGCWPYRIAAKVNPHVVDFLCRKHGNPEDGETHVGDGSTGIVVCDWVGRNGDWDLVRCIVGHNARLELKEKHIEQETIE